MPVAYVHSRRVRPDGLSAIKVIGIPGVPFEGAYTNAEGLTGHYCFKVSVPFGLVNVPPQYVVYGPFEDRIFDEEKTDANLLSQSLAGGFLYEELDPCGIQTRSCHLLLASLSVVPLWYTFSGEKRARESESEAKFLNIGYGRLVECGILLPLVLRHEGKDVAWGVFSFDKLSDKTGEGEARGTFLHSRDWSDSIRHVSFHCNGRLIGIGTIG